MRIGTPRVTTSPEGTEYRVEVDWESGGPAEDLWFRVAAEHTDLVSDRSEAALLGLLLPAMWRGADIHVAGPVSERFHYNLSGPFQLLMRSVIPRLRRIRIEAPEIVAPPPRAAGVATGFSAGIDSFSVLADHHYGTPSPGFRLTHLLYNNVGSHGGAGNAVFRARYERLRPVTERMGLPFVAVDSNLMAFFDPCGGLGFKLTYTVRNAVVALLLQGGIGRSFHAAGTILGQQSLHFPMRDIAYNDPILLPMVSTEALDALSVGGVYTRVYKTLQVGEIEDSYGALDVCVRNDRAGNCGTCKKCVRTLLTLEIAGILDRYEALFDVAAYRKCRRWWVARILQSKYQNSREIQELAEARGYRFPIGERLIGWTRLNLVRAWAIDRASRLGPIGRWVRKRKVERSPIWSVRT